MDSAVTSVIVCISLAILFAITSVGLAFGAVAGDPTGMIIGSGIAAAAAGGAGLAFVISGFVAIGRLATGTLQN